MVRAVSYDRAFFADSDGTPLDSGTLYVGSVNADPQTNPIQCYWDEALSIPATQPFTITAGYVVRSGARATLYVPGLYSLRIRNRAGGQIDYVADPGNVSVQATQAGAVNIADYGAIGDGTLHTVAEWIIPGVLGRYVSLAALQVDYPHVTAATNSIDWAASQAALNALKAGGGGTFYAPCTGSNYVLNLGLTLDLSAVASRFTSRIRFECDGPASAFSLTGLAATALTITGNPSYPEMYVHFDSFRLLGNNTVGSKGLVLNVAAFGSSDGLVIEGFDYNLDCTDVEQIQFANSNFRWGLHGARFNAAVSTTSANSILLTNCAITNNSVWGLQVTNPNAFLMIGGSVQYNGTTGGGATQWGAKLIEAGNGYGTVPFQGVAFEGNGGSADLWLVNATYVAAYSLKGCGFARPNSTSYATNCVIMDGATASTLSLSGNTFRGYNSYVANAGRPYFAINNTSAKIVDDGSNVYGSATEWPAWAGQAYNNFLPNTYTKAGSLLATGSGGHLFTTTAGAAGDIFYWGREYSGAKATGTDASNYGYGPAGWMFDLRHDTADAGTDFARALYVRSVFGGSTAKGGRIGIVGEVNKQLGATNAANANRNYVGIAGIAHDYCGDGGTNTGAGSKGTNFGANFISFLHGPNGDGLGLAGATNLLDHTTVEIDVCADTGTSVRYQRALALCNGNKVRGVDIDAALSFSSVTDAFGTGIGWKHLMLATDANSGDPTYSASWLFGSVWITNPSTKRAITGGFDLSGFDVGSGALFQGAKAVLTEASLTLGASGSLSSIIAGNGSTDASLVLSAKGTGAAYLQDGGAVNRVIVDSGAGIRMVPLASATPANNGELAIQATSNTTLTFKFKGADGTVRSAALTLA